MALFRQEVVNHRAASVFGGVMVTRSRAQWVLTAIAVALAGALIATGWFGTYASKERVPGYVTPSAGLVRVAAPRAGTVASIAVGEGDLVHARQPLFTLVSASDGLSGDAGAATVDSLLEERRTVEARITHERALGDAALADLRRRREEAVRNAAAVEVQLAIAAQRAALLANDVARLDALRERGHVAASFYESRLADLLDARQQIHLLERETARFTTELAAADSEIAQVPRRTELRIAELTTRLITLERDLIAADAQWKQVIRAPVAGRVTAVVASPGMTVGPERPLLTVIPAGSRLHAELLVPAHAAGFVHEGQRVRVRFDAYPFQKFGLYGGTVAAISRTVLLPEDQNGAVRVPVPAYRVVAELDRATVDAYGDALPLRPGLTLQADIVRDRRRLLEWVLDPLFATARSL